MQNVLRNLCYRGSESAADQVLDLYLPNDSTSFPSLVWLHGGALTSGSKNDEVNRRFGETLAREGVAVAMADYRLHPAVQFPAYAQDVLTAWSWIQNHIGDWKGDPRRVLIGGHSAGGYLALLVALDPQFADANPSGVISLSGQTATHFTVREERDLRAEFVVDDAAPLAHVRLRRFPFLVLSATEDMPLRAEENQLLIAALRHVGNCVSGRVVPSRTHSSIFERVPEADDWVRSEIVAFAHNCPRAAE